MRYVVLAFCLLFSTGCVEKKPITPLFEIQHQFFPPILQPKVNHFCDPNYVPKDGQLFEPPPPEFECVPVQNCNQMVTGILRDRCNALI